MIDVQVVSIFRTFFSKVPSKRVYQEFGKLIFGNIFELVNERPIWEITPRPVQRAKILFGEGKIVKIGKKALFIG